MRLPSWTTSSVFAIVLFSVLQVSNAQSASAVGSASVSPIGGCTGLPYSARETQTDIKTNADGTTIEHSRVQLVWRDADGRTRRQTMWKTRTGEEAPEHSVIVYEPVKRVWWTWSYGGNSSAKVAHVRHFRDQDGPASCPAPPSPQAKRNPGDFNVEYLAPTTINGIAVVGNRNTKVMPAGAIGIDHESTIAHEWWISPDLGIFMRHIIDDPRTPKVIVELSDVKRDVPDPALFQVPEGYEVVEEPAPTPTALELMMKDQKPVLPPVPANQSPK